MPFGGVGMADPGFVGPEGEEFDPADVVEPPEGLGDAGRALWEMVTADLPSSWVLDGREAALLGLAAQQADALAELEALVAAEGLTTTGSQGQVVVHPGVGEARQARLAIDRLIGRLALPQPQKAGAETAQSQHARNAANVMHDLAARREARRGA